MKRIIWILILAALPVLAAAQERIPAFPPQVVTNDMDFQQMLQQMHIKLPDLVPRAVDPNRPAGSVVQNPDNPEGRYMYNGHDLNRSLFGLWDNYDDTEAGFFPGKEPWRVGSYTPISLTRMDNGREIRTAEDWWRLRRPEILKDVQESLFGFFPAKEKLPAVTFKSMEFDGKKAGREFTQVNILGEIDCSSYPAIKNAPTVSATLRLPKGTTKPVPVMILISWDMAIDQYWSIMSQQGWGLCIFNPNNLQPDNGASLTDYLIGLVNKGNWRKPSDWGSIGAWSWGISRLIDFLLTDPRIDPKGIGLGGHSRYGKTALYAMACDDRISIGFPSDAGSLGTKMNRRHWGQDLENSATPSEYHWMAGNFLKWCGPLLPGKYLPRQVELCPVDAHSIVALCAPRPVFFNGGTTSQWSDPYGIYLTAAAASPAYELLGRTGLVLKDDKPQVDKAYIEGDLGYRYHNGGHTDAPDWPAFFEFAKKYIDF